MYLKAISLQGFKSFPEKTVLNFDSDITAIVGPNGSGKSNISDAIRWVMGEMSTKVLRSSKMEDVIFGGTLKRPQTGFAEVSLVLDNTEHFFDMEGTEVMVTRRCYRSGESEYYINRQSARLRDINELFMDTGMGREGYSSIGQGRIDEILSAKSTDRREIFEEAAGISHFRHRKEETERTLQKTQENLLRIDDKIQELELQLAPLQKQAEQAEQYLKLQDELRGLEVTVWLQHLEKLSQTVQKAESDFAAASRQLDEEKTALEQLYQKTDQFSASVRDMDIEAEKMRQTIAQTEAAIAEKSGQSAVLQERRAANDENISRLKQELGAQESRHASLSDQIAAYETRINEIDNELEAQENLLQKQKEKRESFQKEGCQESDALLALQEKQSALLQQTASLRASLSANDSDVQKLLDRRAAAETRCGEAEQRIQEALDAQTKCGELLHTAQETAEQLKNVIRGYELRAGGRIEKKKSLEAELSEKTIARDTLASRIRMYREMERSYEGFSKAARIVMQEAERGTLHNIHGPVSRLIRTEDRYTLAVETALGASMQSIVVDTEQDGKTAIALLHRRDGGRATFLPLSVIRGRTLTERGLENETGFVGLASSIVDCQPIYRDLIENLLGRTAVAENMDAAIAIAGHRGHRFRIVTLDGQVLQAGGSMTGGSAAKSSGVLTRANELSRMETQNETLAQEIAQMQTGLREASRQAAEAEAEISDSQNHLREQEDQVLRLGQQQEHYASLLETLRANAAAAQRELDAVTELLEGGNDQRNAMEVNLRNCEKEEAALEQKISAAQTRLHSADARMAGAEQEMHETERQMSALSAERSSAAGSMEELRRLLENLHGDREQRVRSLTEFVEENETLLTQIHALETECGMLRRKVEMQKQTMEQASERRREAEAQKTAAERETQQKNRDIMDMERECSRLEQKKSSSQMEEKQLLDKLWDSYELTRSTAKKCIVDIDSISAAEKQIGTLHRKLSALGQPNLGAIDQYQSVHERYQYLMEQRNDVEISQRELQKIVKDITSEMAEIFRTEFHKINEYFAQTFTEMFGGGHASLQLEDEKDVLSCGIEIRVQPPGKQLKTILLLSGGEKAFVAIALYFALMKVRPTPFCILDEIDAALDDQNVVRFAAYLRKLSSKTQFLVITHRRGTMEAADVLYGVTMQEQGVSKVLSVDLDQEHT